MQNIIVEKPYQFIPPHRGDWIPTLIQGCRIVDIYLRRLEGITSYEVRGVERLKESLRNRHGVVLAPNHCRYADPIAMGWVAREADVFIYTMASWHLFNQSRFQSFAMRLCGGFSVYREGLDRQSLNMAVEILTEAKRPLVVFSEGTVFRTNDLLQPLLDGIGFLARTAARRRQKQDGGRVVIHPVGIKYLFRGDLEQSVEPVLADMERRFTFAEDGRQLPLLDRIARISEAMLTLKEIQYMGHPQRGACATRQKQLIEHLLRPLEMKWLAGRREEAIMPRVKQLRSVIVPHLFKADLTAGERRDLWSVLSDIYVAQQIASHPSDYLAQPTDTRVLETVERLEEDLHDRSRVHRPLHAILEIGEAITVESDKATRQGRDPLMDSLAESLQSILTRLSAEANPLMV